MKLREWSKQHTIGLLIGLATTLICIPLIMFILGQMDYRPFSTMWFKFRISNAEKTRIISLASIGNLFWFHRFLKQEKYNTAYGVIAGTIIFLLVILYLKFIA
jgi:hypothetical protein